MPDFGRKHLKKFEKKPYNDGRNDNKAFTEGEVFRRHNK